MVNVASASIFIFHSFCASFCLRVREASVVTSVPRPEVSTGFPKERSFISFSDRCVSHLQSAQGSLLVPFSRNGKGDDDTSQCHCLESKKGIFRILRASLKTILHSFTLAYQFVIKFPTVENSRFFSSIRKSISASHSTELYMQFCLGSSPSVGVKCGILLRFASWLCLHTAFCGMHFF